MTKSTKNYSQHGSTGGFWFLGFVATFAYYLHYHSGSVWLVFMAFVKAVFWLPVLVYYALQFMKV